MFGKPSGLLVLLLMTVELVPSQTYPTLNSVSIGVRVTPKSSNGYYYYAYSLANNVQNSGKIQEFHLDVTRSSSSVSYDTVGLQFAGSSFMESNFRSRYPILGPYMVPVGFVSLPPWWGAIWGNYSVVCLAMDTIFVSPGGIAKGLVLMSKGIPGISQCTIEPNFNVDLYFPSLDDSSSQMTTDQMDSIRAACAFRGATVGPTAPSDPFNPLLFIDLLSSYATRSRSMGWITTQAVTDKYVGLISRVRGDIVAFDLKTARSRIDTILQQVNIDSSTTVRPEAYALIRFDTEYFRNQLSDTLQVKHGIVNPSGNLRRVD